jgi:hypothetical protein
VLVGKHRSREAEEVSRAASSRGPEPCGRFEAQLIAEPSSEFLDRAVRGGSVPRLDLGTDDEDVGRLPQRLDPRGLPSGSEGQIRLVAIEVLPCEGLEGRDPKRAEALLLEDDPVLVPAGQELGDVEELVESTLHWCPAARKLSPFPELADIDRDSRGKAHRFEGVGEEPRKLMTDFEDRGPKASRGLLLRTFRPEEACEVGPRAGSHEGKRRDEALLSAADHGRRSVSQKLPAA